MFRGISNISVDAKGRVAIPKSYRDQLETDGICKLMVTADPARCLLIYPLPDWRDIEQKLMSLPNQDPYSRTLQRLYVGFATEAEFDGNGRIRLPAKLREFARIERDAVLIGQGKKFELWSEASFDHESGLWPEQINQRELADVPEAIQQLSI